MFDFTLENNPQIKAYFEGSDDYVPTSEFMYLHEHPLIKESFIREIEVLVNKASLCLEHHKVKGKVVDRFVSNMQNLGTLLSEINQESVPKILAELRVTYKLSTELLKQFNFK